MLLRLENTSYANVKKLVDYAGKLNLRLSLVDQDESNAALPGKPLSATALKAMIEHSRKTGAVNMETAHNILHSSRLTD